MELTGEEMEPSTSDSSHHDNTTVRDACAGVARFLSKQRRSLALHKARRYSWLRQRLRKRREWQWESRCEWESHHVGFPYGRA